MAGDVPQLFSRLIGEFLEGQHQVEAISTSSIQGGPVYDQTATLGFEVTRQQQVKIKGRRKTWQERVLAIYSPKLAKTKRQGLTIRLQRAEEELLALQLPPKQGRPKFTTEASLRAKVSEILSKHRVETFFHLDYQRLTERRYIQGYKNRPPRYEQSHRYVLHFSRKTAVIRDERKKLGWRLYATNAEAKDLSLTQVVQVYRCSPRIERNFARLKGKSLGIRPVYVQREDHVIGMVRLLSLALRVLTAIEYVVRQRLYRLGKSLSGLYSGNPRRTTNRPTTEKLLSAFKEITLTEMTSPQRRWRHLTPLSPLQEKILRLLGLSKTIYTQLTEPSDSILA